MIKLSRDERKRIMRGDHAALKRWEEPKSAKGDVVVLSHVGGGKQFLGRTETERKETDGAMIDVPRKPTVWITISADPYSRMSFDQERQEDRLEWVVPFEVTDEREPRRTLAAAPNPRGQSGLKTRWRDPERVPDRETERERMESRTTPESERGYGGGGKSTVDEREGVPDKDLDAFARRVAEENELRRGQSRTLGHLIAEEMRLSRLQKRGITKPQAVTAIKRRAERAAKRLRNHQDQEAA